MERPRKWSTIVAIWGGAIALVGCIAGVASAATDLGWIRQSGTVTPTPVPTTSVVAAASAPPSSTTRTTTTRPTTTRPTTTPRPTDATIDVTYSGDPNNCVLTLVINVGGTAFNPSGSHYTVRHVPAGRQRYTVQGSINCGPLGACQATGSGTLDVQDGATYPVSWRPNGTVCAVALG